MKANFVTGFANGRPDLPPMQAETGLQLRFDDNGVTRGGYTIISYSPASTVIVQVNASQATIDAMKASPDYLWLEDIPENEDAA